MERIEGLSIGLNLDSLKVESGLTDLKSAMSQMNSEMKANLSAFDRSDKSLEKYQTTIDGLSKKIQLQQKIVDKARTSYEKMVAEHGEGSKEAQKAATQYNNQSASLQNMQRSLERAQKGLTDLQEEQRIAASGWSKVSGAADKASSRISSIGDDIKGVGQNIALSITAPIAGAFAGLTKGTDEFRGDMAVLENNARDAGVGVDTIRESMERLSAISTETDSNVEALSNLLALNFSDSGMTKTLDALSGAVLKFPDTLKIEGVADGLQETLATGAAIGPFGELLERMGVNLDTFNDGLTNAIKNGDEENYILQQLADLGLADVNESFRKNNEELVKSREESQKFQQATADLGKALTPIMTAITTGLTNVTNMFNNLSPEGKKVAIVFGGIAAALGPVITFAGIFLTVLGNMVGALAPVMGSIAKAGGLLNWLKIGFGALLGPVGITIAVITALATGFTIAYKKSETFRNIVYAVRDAFVSAYQKVKEFLTTNPQFLAFLDSVRNGFAKAKDLIMQAFGAAMDFVREKISQVKSFWDSDGQQLLQAFRNIFSGISAVAMPIINGLVAAFKWAFPYMKTIFSTTFSILLSIAKSIWSNIKGVIDGGLNIIMGLIRIFSGLFTGDFSKMWQGVKQVFSGAVTFVWNLIQLWFVGKIIKGIGGFVKTFGSKLKGGWDNAIGGIKSFVGKAKDWFDDFVKSGKKKFDDLVEGAKALPGKMGDGIKNMAGKISEGIGAVKDKMVGGLKTGVNLVIDGVNWVLDKVGVSKKKQVSHWIPEYAHGTDGHPGGLAIVGDGKGRNAGPELIQTPDGKVSLSPARDTLVNLPKGSSVMSALDTRNWFDSLPKYAWGVGDIMDAGKTVLSKGGKLIKGAGKAIKDKAFDIWEYVSDPGKLFKKALDLVGFEMPNLPGSFKPATSGIVNKLIDGATGFVKNKISDFGSFDSNAPGNVKSWISAAIKRTGVPDSWLGPLTTIAMKESGGRTGPSTINKWDINWKRGIPSMGLMQTIRPTFDAFKAKGWNDIMNPTHNAAAAINYIKSRYGNVFNVPGIKALRAGKPYVGYATGGRVANNGLYQLAEEGYPEWIIPTDPSRRTEAMKLLALAGKEIAGNKRPNQLPNPTGSTSSSSDMSGIISMLGDILKVLTVIAEKDPSFNVDGHPLARIIMPYLEQMRGQRLDDAGIFYGR